MKSLADMMPARRVHGTRLDDELNPPVPRDHNNEIGSTRNFRPWYLALCAPVILVIGTLMLCAMIVYGIEKLLIPAIADRFRK